MKQTIAALFLIIIIGLVSSCSSGGYNELTFKNDFESIFGWRDTVQLAHGIAHSGFYSSRVDAKSPYSHTFKSKFKDISKEPLTHLHFKIWCYADALPAKGAAVVSVRSNVKDNIVYVSVDLQDYITEAKKWYEIEGDASLNKDQANNPDNELFFYVWNTDSSVIYYDDCNLEFSK
jgi:hypothetical protein